MARKCKRGESCMHACIYLSVLTRSVDNLPCAKVVHWRTTMSKSHRSCVVPSWPNRRDRCKWGLFPSDEEVGGRRVYVRRRLCDTDNCHNASEVCQSVTFARLLKDSDRRRAVRKQWLQKIPRENTPLSKHSCVCSVHFVGGRCDYRRGDVPLIFEGHRVLPPSRSTHKSLGLASAVAEASVSASACADATKEGVAGIGVVVPGPDTEEQDDCSSEPEGMVDVDVAIESVLSDHFYTSRSADLLMHVAERQKQQIAQLEERLASMEMQLETCRKQLQACKLSYSGLKIDPVAFKFYTGLTVENFDNVRTLVGTAPERMDYTGTKTGDHDGKNAQRTARKLSLEDELLLVLVKLRHNFPESDLSNRFTVSQPTISRIFSTWVLCLYFTFKEIPIWPSRRLVDLHMPVEFKAKYPSTRVIIDATEFRMEKPANPDVQAATWSNYKNTNTFKLLVGVTPNGVISFLSSLWGGRISDKEITTRSGLLDLLEPGDSVMADRGFDIESIMPAETDVNMPPFLRENVQFDEKDLIRTRRIASLRIHVERAMERIKNFQITNFFPATLCPLAEQIIFVCAFLTLFEPPLVPSSA